MSDRSLSMFLYQDLCKILGNEEMVRTKRLVSSSSDFILSNATNLQIASGSTGEGLDQPGSYLHVVSVLNSIPVFEQLSVVPLRALGQQSLVMDTVDTKPGYTKLKLINISDSVLLNCIESDESEVYCQANCL